MDQGVQLVQETQERKAVVRRKPRPLPEGVLAAALLLPSLVVLSVVIFYPLVQVLSLSVRRFNLLMPAIGGYVGLGNFKRLLLLDGVFWKALANSVTFTVGSVAGAFLIGFALAILLSQPIAARNVVRGLALVPWVIPGVIVALLFLYMYNGEVGVINWTLKSAGLITDLIPWFGSTAHALPALIVANIWNQFPFYMLMLLAGLQLIPDDLVEAATLDGATPFQRFRYVTLPYLRSVIMIVTALMVIWNFNNFDLIWTTTQGGPINSTTTLAIYVYRQAFINYEFGYASAISVVWLVLLLLFSTFYIRAMEGEQPW